MKTRPLDVLIFPFILIVAGASVFLIASIVPFTTAWLGDYHAVIDFLLFLLGFGILSAISMRIVVGVWPLRAGIFLWEEPHASYWKLFALTYMFGRGALLPFTPDLCKPLVAKLFGAKIGKGVAIAGHINEPPLISIGDYAILGQYTVITPHAITSGKLILGRITIGNRVTIGVGSVIMPGVEIGDGAMVMPNTFVPMNTKITAGEIWGGNPITKIREASAP
ncbi:MAG TPA: hypothetical protein VGJ57_00265 [Nitrospirales bacterium]